MPAGELVTAPAPEPSLPTVNEYEIGAAPGPARRGTISQLGSIEKMEALEAPRDKLPALYCVFQAKARPELVLRKRRSGWPSPLRSATASTFHAGSMPKRN